jgi:hypothetical protein
VDPAARPSAAQLLAMPYFSDTGSWLTPEFRRAQVLQYCTGHCVVLPLGTLYYVLVLQCCVSVFET